MTNKELIINFKNGATTYQSNEWIRVNEYTIEFDDENNEYIERAEMFIK